MLNILCTLHKFYLYPENVNFHSLVDAIFAITVWNMKQF